jgi:sterol desaturase/sphingolipid hydroxylase (fatty acid hydroxylase superfamily)
MARTLEKLGETFPQFKKLFNWIFIALALGFISTLLSKVVFSLYTPLYIFAGSLLADYVAGTGHMLLDKFKLAEEHHEKPWLIVHKEFFVQIGESLLINIFAWNFILPQTQLWIWTCLIASLGELNHVYHHKKEVPEILKFLWKYNILLSSQKHKVHHIEALQGKGKNYCVITGFTEPLVVLTEKGLDFAEQVIRKSSEEEKLS